MSRMHFLFLSSLVFPFTLSYVGKSFTARRAHMVFMLPACSTALLCRLTSVSPSWSTYFSDFPFLCHETILFLSLRSLTYRVVHSPPNFSTLLVSHPRSFSNPYSVSLSTLGSPCTADLPPSPPPPPPPIPTHHHRHYLHHHHWAAFVAAPLGERSNHCGAVVELWSSSCRAVVEQ